MRNKLAGKFKLFSTLKRIKLWILSPVVAKIQHGICKWIWCWQTSEATPQRGTCWTHDFLDPPENEISVNQNKRILEGVTIFEQCWYTIHTNYWCSSYCFYAPSRPWKTWGLRNVTTSTVLCHLTSKKLNQRKGKIEVLTGNKKCPKIPLHFIFVEHSRNSNF